MIFKQIFDKKSSTYTYLIATSKGREALLIDPVIESINEYISVKEMKNALFLIDIEGNEYDLINSSNIKFIKKSHLIIEIHPFLNSSNKKKRFYSLLKKNFKTKILTTSSRNPHVKGLENLTDDERWMIVSEGRPMQMSWLVCSPR